MILVEVLIENYKQYAGEHKIPVPEGATIGVIGANGVGKTTLFEAIEWCLYNPNTIKNEQVRPRGLASHTKVAVTMVKPETGERFVVERTLKKAGVSAAIYRVDEDASENVVVQGTRQVSDYVGTRLIGLGHAAFVSTFFTRQKELSFFGHLGETERRREVGKLLGLHTIRAAQESINEERKEAKAEADSLRRQYADQSEGRDFAVELDAAGERIVATETVLLQTTEALEAATTRVNAAAESRTKWQRLKDEDAELHRTIVTLEGKLHGVEERVQLQGEELARIVKREEERERLRPIAAGEPRLADAMHEQDALSARFQHQEQLKQQLAHLADLRDGQIQRLRKHVISVALTERVEGWAWHAATDSAAPLDAVARLQTTLTRIDVAAADARAEALVRCQEADKEHHEASKKLARYLARRQEVDTDREVLLRGGDPRIDLTNNETARNQAQAAVSDAYARAAAMERDRKQTDALLHNLQHARFEDICPTCARPFSAAEVQLVIASLQERRETLNERIAGARHDEQAAQRRVHDLSAARLEIEKRVSTLQALMGSLQASEAYLMDQRTVLNDAEHFRESALRVADLEHVPDSAVVAQASARAALFHKLHDKCGELTSLEHEMRQCESSRTAVSTTLMDLGDVQYDAVRHKEVADNLRRAGEARVALKEIEREVARRPNLEEDIASGQGEIARLTAERNVLAGQRVALGFDGAALIAAEAEEHAAQRAERTARDARGEAQSAQKDAVLRRDLLQKEHERITRLAARADCRGRDADQLDLMVREFNAFEKYVAGHYGPILAETTSQLVGQVTDGRYNRVEFDESYGIEIFDGDDEKFPLATFSGGERDAIALCARLALSQMIGAQAASPPGFLVLDEVFGSLDRDRRARLLDLLGSLAGTFNQFHQLFVISHVDDVQGSAVFDEVWRVEETADGASQIANATRGDGLAGIDL